MPRYRHTGRVALVWSETSLLQAMMASQCKSRFNVGLEVQHDTESRERVASGPVHTLTRLTKHQNRH